MCKEQTCVDVIQKLQSRFIYQHKNNQLSWFFVVVVVGEYGKDHCVWVNLTTLGIGYVFMHVWGIKFNIL